MKCTGYNFYCEGPYLIGQSEFEGGRTAVLSVAKD